MAWGTVHTLQGCYICTGGQPTQGGFGRAMWLLLLSLISSTTAVLHSDLGCLFVQDLRLQLWSPEPTLSPIVT